MGIPSYFSHVIRNYAKIVRSFSTNKVQIHHLKMDCNSIIYDTFYKMEGQFSETRLINEVITNIEKYIREIRPLETVHIAFDGVAPFAKMNQQRTRRYKSHLMTTLDFAKKPAWSTSNITPGTEFMNELSRRVGEAFRETHVKFGVHKVIVSGSDEIGEGEHKLFADIRANHDTTKNVAVYGLDADLIMLSIFHMKYYKNAYIIREAPEFIKSSVKLEKDDGLAIMDIGLMCDKLTGGSEPTQNLNNGDSKNTPEGRGRRGTVGSLLDYVFMCFLLGNDFLPHFPALNIRTHGIATLIDLYSKVIGNYPGRRFISETDQIQWKNVAIFIRELAKMEHPLLLEEYELRDKQDNRFWKITTKEEREIAFNNLPMMYRQEEKYICPTATGWEARYYKSLLDGEMPTAVAENYLEGLEWVFKYYSGDCPDWQWTYRYNYPPLFSDLQRCVPENEMKLLGECRTAFTPEEQLKYVLFTEQQGAGIATTSLPLLDREADICAEGVRPSVVVREGGFHLPKIQWAFCRYFWEAHVDFPEK